MEWKKKLWAGFAAFMMFMLVMTFVSRMYYVSSLPVIRWSYPSASSIRNEFVAEGTVETVDSQAVMGMEGLLVKQVCVAAGEQISQGTILYEVDMEDLQERLSQLEAEEAVWQEQVQAQKNDAAANIARTQQDYDSKAAEQERKIAGETALLEDAQADLDTHLSREPGKDATEETKMAWEDEKIRIQREIEVRRRTVEDAQSEKENALREAGRNIEDAKRAQSEIEGGYSAAFSSIGQVQARENQIAAWKELLENEGKALAVQEGRVLEVMLQSGMRMGSDAVIRYADAKSTQVFRTIITQEQKSRVHTGDSVQLTFPGNSAEVSETIDSIVQEDGGYTVTIWLDAGVGEGCTEGTMRVVSTSQVYDYVIPKQALHNDGNTNFIYVLEEKNGILGTELSVRKMVVGLLEQNDSNVAVADDLLQGDMKIVTESDKELSNGAAVKEWYSSGKEKE
ncbi:MAG: hypothetical protein NC307_02045 [Roseburia sp.]|nr:hypothetical protein [Roseburia sp.]